MSEGGRFPLGHLRGAFSVLSRGESLTMLRVARRYGLSGIGNPANTSADRHRAGTACHDLRRQHQGHSVRPTRCSRSAPATRRTAGTIASRNRRGHPAAIAAKLSESLRQKLVASGIPETAQALAVVSKQRGMRSLSNIRVGKGPSPLTPSAALRSKMCAIAAPVRVGAGGSQR